MSVAAEATPVGLVAAEVAAAPVGGLPGLVILAAARLALR